MAFNVGFSIGGNIAGTFSGGNPDTFTPTGNDARADADTVGNDLQGGKNVVITTGSGGSQNGDLTVDAGLSLTAQGTPIGTLTLQAAGAIAIQQHLLLQSAGLALQAGAAITQSAAVTVGGLSVSAMGGVNLGDAGNAIGTLNGLTAGGDASLVDAQSLNIAETVNVGAHALSLSDIANAGSLTVNGSVTADAATLSSAGLVSITGSGSVAVSTSLTVNAASASTIAGVISGAGSLVQAGTGVLTLTGMNTYGGGSMVNASTLQVGNGGAAGSITGTVAVAQNALLEFSRSDATTFGGVISGAGAVEVDSGGTLTLGAANTYAGGTTVTGGATLIASNSHDDYGSLALGSGAVTLNGGALSSDSYSITNGIILGANGGTIRSDAAHDAFALASGITGSGTLTLDGAGGGMIQFGGAASGGSDTHTGATLLINNVQVIGVKSLSANSAVQISSGSSLSAFSSQTLGSLAGAGAVSAYRSAVAVTTGVSGADSTFTGVLSNGGGTLALTKSGAGVFTLAGTETYTGATTVNGGALVVDGSGTIASSATTVTSTGSGSTATYGLLGGTGTVGSVRVAMGATLAPGDYATGASSVGQLHTGAITLASGAHFAEQLGGAMGAYDQVTAAGNVVLGGATLDLSALNGFTPTNGSSFDILHLTSGTISGQFAQGSTVTTSDGHTYAITYSSTDVTLSYPVPAPPPPPPSGPPAGSHVLTSGADTDQTGNGGEIVYGEGGSDTLLGGTGGDTLVAGGYPGQATQGFTSDHVLIEGGAGNDSLQGGIGHDQVFGQMGDDRIVVAAGSQGDQVYGGQGNDFVDASASNAPNYLSGDIGNDTLMSGAGFETVLGGQGDDVVVGGSRAGAGSLQLLFGNQGNDTLSYAGHGSVEMFGGQDDDTLSVTTSGQGQTHYLFGNLGNDTLTASGGYDSLYGGQGDDVVSAAGDYGGHNYLSGDIGDDVISASYGGFDTVRGGPGADTITLGYHAGGGADTVLLGAGDSSAQPGAGETNLDHVSGFDFSRDKIVITGHASGTSANVTVYSDTAASSSEAQAFAAAYTYAYGDGTSAHAAHVGTTEYLAVQESYGGATAVYLFAADHTAVAFTGAAAAGFQANAIVGG